MPKKQQKLPTTKNGWIRRWRRSLDTIRFRAADFCNDQQHFTEYRTVIDNNESLDKRNAFFNLLHRMYVEHMLIGLRTFDDKDQRSHSLYRLLSEIQDHPNHLDRRWFAFNWKSKRKADRQFDRDWGQGSFVDPLRVQRDLRTLVKTCRRIRTTVNKFIAHDSRRKPRVQLGHEEIKTALEEVYGMISRYNILLFGSAWGKPWSPPISDVFETPWASLTE